MSSIEKFRLKLISQNLVGPIFSTTKSVRRAKINRNAQQATYSVNLQHEVLGMETKRILDHLHPAVAD